MPTYLDLENISRQERNRLRREMSANNRIFFGVVEPYGLDTQTGIRTEEVGDVEITNKYLDEKNWHSQLQRVPFSHRGIVDSTILSLFRRTDSEKECSYLTDEEHNDFTKKNNERKNPVTIQTNMPGTGSQLALIWRKSAHMTWRLKMTNEENMGIPLSQEESNFQLQSYLHALTLVKWNERPNFKLVEAVLLRANEIASHPHYNWCVQACGGNGLDMHGAHNWHLPAIIMAISGGPTPGRVEHAMQKKDVVALILNFGNAFYNESQHTPNHNSDIGRQAALAIQELADDQRTTDNQVNRILAEGFHLQNLWDICNANPDLAHNGLHPASNEENLFRLNSQNPRIEGLGIEMAEEVAAQIYEYEKTYQIKLSTSLVVVNLQGQVLYGEAYTELARQLETYDRPRRARQDTDHHNKLIIDETMVDNDGYYIGPDLSNFNGNIEVTVPCFYSQNKNGNIRITGDLTLRDGKGGNYLSYPETGTIFATDANLIVTGNIISKNEEGGLGAQRFCLLAAGSVTAGEQIDLSTANIKATSGGITAKKIDASAILCHGKIVVEQGIYASRISVGNGLDAKEIHSDWLQGTGPVNVKNKITLMFSAMLNGPITAESILILNPRQIPNSPTYKAPVVCTRLRVQSLEPNGVYQPLQGIDHPVNTTLAPGSKVERLLI